MDTPQLLKLFSLFWKRGLLTGANSLLLELIPSRKWLVEREGKQQVSLVKMAENELYLAPLKRVFKLFC